MAQELKVTKVMRVGIPSWQGRVSPVFDVAGTVLLADVRDGRVAFRAESPLTEAGLAERVRRVVELEIEVLICGAISRPLEAALTCSGVQVVGHTCGAVEEVLQAFIDGRLDQEVFWMPGCGRWRMRRRRGCGPPGVPYAPP